MSNYEEIYNDVVTERENILKTFLKTNNISDSFAYNFTDFGTKLTIYTSKPGIWIGFKGETVNSLKEYLKKELDKDVEIIFKEIKAKFIAV